MAPVSKRESDVRACTLAACHDVGLYPHIHDPDSDEFLDSPCLDPIEASEATCPVGPPYNTYLMEFRQRYRYHLKTLGYKTIRTFLQRLCTKRFTWRIWASYHSSPTLLRKRR